jgi:hypothetical protein
MTNLPQLGSMNLATGLLQRKVRTANNKYRPNLMHNGLHHKHSDHSCLSSLSKIAASSSSCQQKIDGMEAFVPLGY